MSDFLVQHALTNVWCSPQQDQQVVFAPTRISPYNGAIDKCSVLWDTIPLPDKTSIFHVYQIGQVAPALLDLLPDPNIWRLVAENMKDNNLIMDVYTMYGLNLPRIETYILVNYDKNVLLAIKDQTPFFDVTTNQIFLRIYSNAFFSSTREAPTADKVDIYGRRVRNNADTLDLQHKYAELQALPGLVSAYVGGYLVNAFNPFVVDHGTVVELVYDSSVKHVVELPVASLPIFTSVLDSKFKYLLHPPGEGDGIIDFLDDIDVFLINRTIPGPVPAFRGIYYHKNSIDAVRQITHKDYSIVVPFVVAYANAIPGWDEPEQLTVRLHIRNSGYARPLVPEANRVVDMYKLPSNIVKGAMVGTNATLVNWQAATLENSLYPKIMDAMYYTDITQGMVESAYGYGAISRLLGESPVFAVNVGGAPTIYIPPGLQRGCTVLEYDAGGVLLGHGYCPIGYAYQAHDSATAWAELISGTGSVTLTSGHSVQSQILVPYQNYRFYKCPLINGFPQSGGWDDVTGDATQYIVINDVVTWFVDFTQFATLVRDDLNFLLYNHTVTPADGQFLFSITSTETYGSSQINAPMQVPVGQLDLYLNGHILVENIDYFVEWPQVCIVNTTFLMYNQDESVGAQVVTVLGTGFCNIDLTRMDYVDTGFVKYGAMSRNEFFNLRDDKVLKIGVNGGVYPRSMTEFTEDNPSSPMTLVPNGSPYGIRQVIVPTLNNTITDTYTLYNTDKAIDLAVEDYLTLYAPEHVETNPDEILQLYPIYSPFCAKVMFDLVNNVIDWHQWMNQYSEQDVRNALVGYTHLLDFEPTYKDLDLDHIVVNPHNLPTVVTLNYYQHKFLAMAVDTFLNNEVNLSTFVAILPTLI